MFLAATTGKDDSTMYTPSKLQTPHGKRWKQTMNRLQKADLATALPRTKIE